VILCGSSYLSFEREDPGVGVHERGVGGDGPAEGLAGHGHVDNDDAILRGGLPDADVPLRLHGDMGEGDELRRDPQAGEREGLAHGDGGVGRRHGGRRRWREDTVGRELGSCAVSARPVRARDRI
jgi:hypothetical protein